MKNLTLIIPTNKKNLFYFLAGLGLIFPLIVFLQPNAIISSFTILILGIFLGLLIIFSLARPFEQSKIIIVFFLGLLSRLTLSVVFYLMSFFSKSAYKHGFLFLNDGYPYSENGWLLLKMKQAGLTIDPQIFYSKYSLSGAIGNYNFFNSFIYFLTGKDPLCLIFLNCVAGSLAIIITYLIAREFVVKRTALLLAIIIAFLPSLNLWSTQNFKEPLVNLGLLCFMFFLVKFNKRFRFWSLIFALFGFFVLFYLRRNLLNIAIFCLLLNASLYLIKLLKINRKLIVILVTIFIVIVILFQLFIVLTNKQFVNEYIIGFKNYITVPSESFLNNLITMRMNRTGGNTALFMPETGSFLGVVMYIVTGLLFSFLAPFPWTLISNGSFFYLITLIEMLFYYFCLFFFFKGIVIIIKDRKNLLRVLPLLVFTIVYFVILALFEGNAGTLFRHRSTVLPLFLFFCCYAIHYKRRME